MIVQELTEPECRSALKRASFGRLACARAHQPYVVPIFFAVSGELIYSFAIPGQKVVWMRDNPLVCLETDAQDSAGQWTSVVVLGRYIELTDTTEFAGERQQAHTVLQTRPMWWEPGALTRVGRDNSAGFSPVFYRIAIEQISGLRYVPTQGDKVA